MTSQGGVSQSPGKCEAARLTGSGASRARGGRRSRGGTVVGRGAGVRRRMISEAGVGAGGEGAGSGRTTAGSSTIGGEGRAGGTSMGARMRAGGTSMGARMRAGGISMGATMKTGETGWMTGGGRRSGGMAGLSVSMAGPVTGLGRAGPVIGLGRAGPVIGAGRAGGHAKKAPLAVGLTQTGWLPPRGRHLQAPPLRLPVWWMEMTCRSKRRSGSQEGV